METQGTVEIIKKMCATLRSFATDWERIAKRMEETGDLSYAGEICNGVAGLMQNLRLDLVVTRPIREYEREKDEHLFLLKQVLFLLPQNRDWLDPDIEKQIKEAVKG